MLYCPRRENMFYHHRKIKRKVIFWAGGLLHNFFFLSVYKFNFEDFKIKTHLYCTVYASIYRNVLYLKNGVPHISSFKKIYFVYSC